jgi:hypothetical protein
MVSFGISQACSGAGAYETRLNAGRFGGQQGFHSRETLGRAIEYFVVFGAAQADHRPDRRTGIEGGHRNSDDPAFSEVGARFVRQMLAGAWPFPDSFTTGRNYLERLAECVVPDCMPGSSARMPSYRR